MRSADPRAGFTLAEALVALVLSGFVVAAVLQMLATQARLVATQSAREEAQQNARGALEVISAELRGAIPEGILSAGAQSLTYMQPRIWGVVCGFPSASQVDLLVPAEGASPGWSTGQGGGLLFLATRPGDPARRAWIPAPGARTRVTSVQTLPGGPLAGACSKSEAGGAATVSRVAFAPPLSGPADSLVGNPAVHYVLTRYDLGQSDGQWWVRRSNGVDEAGTFQQQPLAGAVDPDRFALTYFGGGGGGEIAPPGSAAPGAGIRRIRIQVVALGARVGRGPAQRDSGAVDVSLRN